MLLNELPAVMLRCLAVTALVEALAAFGLGVRSVRGQIIVLLCNVLTNPLVVSLNVLFTFYFGRVGHWCSLLVLEAAAFTSEAAVYRALPPCRKNPFFLSAVLNGSSFLIGLLWNQIFA